MSAVIHIRNLSLFLALALFAGCGGSATDVRSNSPVGSYALTSVDASALPACPEACADLKVASGAITLQSDGYFVVAETDSGYWLVPPRYDTAAWQQQKWTEGGNWSADGTILTLTDTITPIFGGSSQGDTYSATIAPHTILLDRSSGTGKHHTYRYER